MIIEISKNISKNTTFSKGNSYVIIGEIHVLSGVTLRIDPNVAVYIRNGEYPSSVLKKSVLRHAQNPFFNLTPDVFVFNI